MLLVDITMGKTHKDKNKNSKQAERNTRKDLKKQRQVAKSYDSPEEKKFASDLAELGLVVKIMEGDGNCLFRALSDQVLGNSKQHYDIRKQICEYIETNKEHFGLFVEDDEPFDDYVSRMKVPGEWGGHQELYAASQSLQVNIFVHQVDGPRYILTCKESTMDIHISYHGECHYNSVRSKRDPDNGEKPILIDMKEILRIIEEKQDQLNKVRENNTNGQKSSYDATKQTDYSFNLMNQWVSPDIVQFVKESYEAIEDYCEEALETVSTLTGVNEITNDEPQQKERSKSSSRRKATQNIVHPSTVLSKKEARKAGKEQLKVADESNDELKEESKSLTKVASLGIEI